MKNKLMMATLLAASVLFIGCAIDPEIIIKGNDLEVTIPENPMVGQVLGKIIISIMNADNSSITLGDADVNGKFNEMSNYLSFDENTGEVTVTDSTIFDFEQQDTYYAQINVEASNRNYGNSTPFRIVITLTNVKEASEFNVQERLDGGETPLEIYNADNTYLDSLYGKNYAGGLIFYLNTADGSGLVAAEADLSTTYLWDDNDPVGGFLQTNDTLTAIGTGATNTAGIIADLGDGTYAAKACSDLTLNGHSDWFLPSLDELHAIWENLHNVGLGNLTNGFYWSSSETENGGNQAYHSDFTNPIAIITTGAFKNDSDNVRAVRAF